MLSKASYTDGLQSDRRLLILLGVHQLQMPPFSPILPLKSREDTSQLNCHYGTFCSNGFCPRSIKSERSMQIPPMLHLGPPCFCCPNQVTQFRNSSSLCTKRSLYSVISHPYRFWSWRPSLLGLLSYLRSGLPSSRRHRSSEARPSRLGLRLLDLDLV
jgi:hypothetical protein